MSVVIYGATGFTGTLIAQQLAKRGVEFAIAGRDKHRLETLRHALGKDVAAHVAHVHKPSSLTSAFDGAKVVINCAGPFRQLGESVVKAAIDVGAHYLDTSGEQRFMRDVLERFEAAARRAQVTVINGLAFEIALGDWLATIAAQELVATGPLDELTVSYAVEHLHPTRGTQLSALSSLSEPGCVWSGDRWEEVTTAAEVRPVKFPEPFGLREALSFPSGEVIAVPRHIEAQRVQTFISLIGDSQVGRLFSRATSLVAPVLPLLLRSPLGEIARATIGASATSPDDAQRRSTRFAIVARAERSFERHEANVVGSDLYGITAHVVADGCETLLAGAAHAVGVVAPSVAFDAQTSLGSVVAACDLTLKRVP